MLQNTDLGGENERPYEFIVPILMFVTVVSYLAN